MCSKDIKGKQFEHPTESVPLTTRHRKESKEQEVYSTVMNIVSAATRAVLGHDLLQGRRRSADLKKKRGYVFSYVGGICTEK